MFGVLFQRAIRAGRIIACAALLAGCTSIIRNDPINQPLTANPAQVDAELAPPNPPANDDDMVVAMSFSGGGTRAAAFSYGVLTGFQETPVPARGGPVSLLDRLDFLSGVSGGSILAAYYGLQGPRGARRFQAALSRRQCRGGAADRFEPRQYRARTGRRRQRRHRIPGLARRASVQSRHLPGSASRPRPRVWINASDIYNRTTFIFAPVTFSALCSDLANYPVSLGVAASAAVPVVFAPIVIQNFTAIALYRCQAGSSACAAIPMLRR